MAAGPAFNMEQKPRSKAERYRHHARKLRAIADDLTAEKAAYLRHIADEYDDLADRKEAENKTAGA